MRTDTGDMTYLDISSTSARWPRARDGRARVLLVAINFDDYYSLPVRILALNTATDDTLRQRFDIRYLEWGLSEDPGKHVRRIRKYRPDVLGLSVNVWNRDRMFDVAAALKKGAPEICVVAGGQEVTGSVVDYLADVAAVDYIIEGEGEVAFRSFLEHWDRDSGRVGDPSAVPGLQYRQDGVAARTAKAEPMASLDQLPSVVLAGLVPINKTRSLGVLLESTRGCPFRCSFCFEAARKGKPASASVERLGREIDFMVARGAGSFHMMDPILCNSDPERLRALSRILKEAEERHGRRVRVSVEAYGDQVTEEMAGYLGESAIVDVGLQSTNPETIKAIHRPFLEDRFCAGVKHLRQAGAAVNIYIITGLPYETFATSLRGMRFAIEQRPTRLFLNELSLLNGTELRRRAGEYGYDFDANPPYLVKSSRWISAFEMSALYRLSKDVERRHNLSFTARPLDMPMLPRTAASAGGCLRVDVGGECAWQCPGCARAGGVADAQLPSPERFYEQAAGKDVNLFTGDGVSIRDILHHAAQFQLSGAERIRLTAPPSLFDDADSVGRMVGAGIWQYRTFVDFDGESCGAAVLDLQRVLENVKMLGRSFRLRGRGDLRPYVEVVALVRNAVPAAFQEALEQIRNEVEAIHLPGLAGTGLSIPVEDLRAMFLDAVESTEEVERMNRTSSRFRTAGRDYWPKLPGAALQRVLADPDGVEEIVEHLGVLGLLACDTARPPCFLEG